MLRWPTGRSARSAACWPACRCVTLVRSGRARRDALLALDLRDRTYGWPLEMVLRAGRAGLRVAEVPVAYRLRTGTSKVTGRPWPTAKAAARMVWVLVRHATARK